MSYPDFLLDKRVLGRNIAKGLVDKKVYDEHLEALPDVEANSEPCGPYEPERGDSGDGSAPEPAE